MTGIVNMVFMSAGDDGDETLQFNQLRYKEVQLLPTSLYKRKEGVLFQSHLYTIKPPKVTLTPGSKAAAVTRRIMAAPNANKGKHTAVFFSPIQQLIFSSSLVS